MEFWNKCSVYRLFTHKNMRTKQKEKTYLSIVVIEKIIGKYMKILQVSLPDQLNS